MIKKIENLIMRLGTNTGFMTVDRDDSDVLVSVLTEYVKIKGHGIR